MSETLKIEIEAEDKNKVHTLLKHIFKEIIEGPDYTNSEVNDCSDLENNLKWLIIKEGKFKGKYRWSTMENIG